MSRSDACIVLQYITAIPATIGKENEQRHEKTCLRDFRPGTTQTGLLSHRD